MIRALLLSVLVFAVPAFAVSNSDEAVQKRLQPVGQVQVEGDVVVVDEGPDGQMQVEEEAIIVGEPEQKSKAPHAKDASPMAASAGKKVYDTYCSVCHAAGVAGAPKFRDEASWQKRADKPIADLVKSVQNGLNAMPPKGMCSNCTSAEFQAAIEYMLPKK